MIWMMMMMMMMKKMMLMRIYNGGTFWEKTYLVHIVTKHLDTIFVAAGGQVSTTKLTKDREIWRVSTAAHTAVWWLQNSSKTFEALTTAVLEVK